MSKFFNLIKDAERVEQLIKEALAAAISKVLAKALGKTFAKASGGALTKSTVRNILTTVPKDQWAAQLAAQSGGKITSSAAKSIIKNEVKVVAADAAKKAAAKKAAKELAKFPKGWNPASSPVINTAQKQGLKLNIDKTTGAVSVKEVPSSWIDPSSGRLTQSGAQSLKKIEQELLVQSRSIQTAAKADAIIAARQARIAARSQAQLRRAQNWESFKASLPVTAAKGAAVLTGIAGLYAMFSGKPSVPASTPAQQQLVSSMVNLNAATQLPSADDTIAALQDLNTTLSKLKQNKSITDYAGTSSAIIKTLNSLKSLSGLDSKSLSSYDSLIKKLSSDIALFNTKSENIQSLISKASPGIQKLNISDKIDVAAANLGVYESQIQAYRVG
jgi:hypothetical protein